MEANPRHGEAALHAGGRYEAQSCGEQRITRRVRRLASALERLAYEIHRIGDKEEHEREKLALQFENRLLQFEKLLPSAKPNTEQEKKE